ncbi:cell division protein ZapA [Clostridium folliculivorans]|uniref:cell division protein ZapA n=1 Tax=Clostridium folliculivorans TaxID=2886038 RepID=UPI0021C2AF9A|nr:cell division protein ZapA [Clostridium folliculivorans]GKU30047.1 cell division protein ZapA [Clostridium folliculivorans]
MGSVTVRINGIDYNLKGKDDEEYLNYIANYVDEKVKEILSKNNKLSSVAATVLAAINISDELFKVNNDYNDLLGNFESLQKENDKLKQSLEDVERKEDEEKEEYVSMMQAIEDLKLEKLSLEEKNSSLLEVLNSKNNELEELKNVQLDEGQEDLSEQITELESAAKKLLEENNSLKLVNREMKFELQSSKYKVMDLEKKYLDSQIKLATEIKKREPYLKVKDNK